MNPLKRSSRNLGTLSTLSLALVTTLVVGCSSDDEAPPADATAGNGSADAALGSPDAMPSGPDAMQAAVQIPTWTLEDIQPASPKSGQVYGLSEFTGRILVVVLVDGF